MIMVCIYIYIYVYNGISKLVTPGVVSVIVIILVVVITIMIHPVSIRFPLRRFSPGAGLLRNPFVHR